MGSQRKTGGRMQNEFSVFLCSFIRTPAVAAVITGVLKTMDFSEVLYGTVDIVYFKQIDEDSQNTLRHFTKVNLNSIGFFNLL